MAVVILLSITITDMVATAAVDILHMEAVVHTDPEVDILLVTVLIIVLLLLIIHTLTPPQAMAQRMKTTTITDQEMAVPEPHEILPVTVQESLII